MIYPIICMRERQLSRTPINRFNQSSILPVPCIIWFGIRRHIPEGCMIIVYVNRIQGQGGRQTRPIIDLTLCER